MIRVSFSLFLSLSVFCYFTLLLIFMKIILLLLLFFFFFYENYFYFFMFRDVPGCSGMFRNVPCSWFYRRPSRSSLKRFKDINKQCNLNAMNHRKG